MWHADPGTNATVALSASRRASGTSVGRDTCQLWSAKNIILRCLGYCAQYRQLICFSRARGTSHLALQLFPAAKLIRSQASWTVAAGSFHKCRAELFA